MVIYVIFLLFLSSLMGWWAVKIFFYLLRKRVMPANESILKEKMISATRQLDIEGEMIKQFDQFDLEKEISPLIENRIENLVGQLKHEIPMGEILLSGPLADRLKERARQEILKGLPEIKDRLAQRIKEEFGVENKIEEVVNRMDADKLFSFLQSEFPGGMRQLNVLGALIGLAFGIVAVTLLFFTASFG